MAVQGPAVKMWSRTSGSLSLIHGDWRDVTIQEAWSVVCEKDDVIQDVLNAENLPQMCDSFPNAEYIKVAMQNPQRISPVFWIVGITYKGLVNKSGYSDSPVNQPPLLTWSDVDSEEATDEDTWGNPIVTANGEPIDGVTTKLADVQLQVKRNFREFNPAVQHAYRHSVNSDQFVGFAPGVAKLTKMSAVKQWHKGCGAYWEVTGNILFRYPWRTHPYRSWYARIRHEGFYERQGTKMLIGAPDQAFGVRAWGYLTINNATGAITGAVLVNGGSGYTSSPSVTITNGSGTVTATVGGGQVTGLSVTASGSGNVAYVVRAVDDNDEPTTKPVLLDPGGFRIYDTTTAFWQEWQLYKHLPYSVLGLVDSDDL